MLLLVLACTPEKEASEPVVHDYSAPGAWTAATSESSFTGSTGVELPVQIWYPSKDTEGSPVKYDGMVDGTALENASPDCSAPRPVVVFSHGSGGIRWQSTFFTEFLATNGWIVVAPDHSGNTFFDGDFDVEEIAVRRPQDMADTFDWLIAQSGAGGFYEGCVDAADGYAVVGHSFGGYTTYATAGATVVDSSGASVALGDGRVWAGVAWAPWDVEGAIVDGAANITVPMATLGGTLDETLTWESQENLHNHVTSTPRALGEFPHAGHYSFSPVACTLAGLTGDGCGDSFISLDIFTALVNTSTYAFLAEAHGETGALEQLPPASADLTWTVVQ